MPPEICPHCGAEIPPNAKACPECGSDEQTGWAEEAHTGALDLPDQEFDYDDFVKREFGSSPKPAGIKPVWWIAAIILAVAFAVMYLRGAF